MMKTIAVLLLFLPLLNYAQSEKSAVTGVVNDFFEAMRTADAPKADSCLYADLSLYTVLTNAKGEVKLMKEERKELIDAFGSKHEETWDERISGIEVRIDGPLAVLSCDYKFYLGDKYSHSGIDVFELIKTERGWKIFSISDTRRK